MSRSTRSTPPTSCVFAQLQSLSATSIIPQTYFYDGQYKASELTLNADFSRDFTVGMASPLSVAFGGEYRRNTYGIGQGEPSSYIGGGAQSFSGYTPQDQGDFSRTNYAGYIDIALDPIKNLHLDLAGRYRALQRFRQHRSWQGDGALRLQPGVRASRVR